MVAVKRPLLVTPEDAETAFYAAFERGDLQAMMTVWAEDETIVCVHPLGPLLRTTDDSVAVHIVYEHIELPGQRPQAVIATNAYRRAHSGWYMILHHASPTSAGNGAAATTLH